MLKVACDVYSVENYPSDSRVLIIENGICQTLFQYMGTGGGNVPLVLFVKTIRDSSYNCLMKHLEKLEDNVDAIVRRLTPVECCRLQGFPDAWGEIDHKEDFTDEEFSFWLDVRQTHDAINGRKHKEYTKEQLLKWYNGLHKDSAEYKMWGNGIALPCALYVMEGIVEETNAGD